MEKLISTIVVAASIVSGVALAGPGEGNNTGSKKFEKIVERMKTSLELSDDQTEQIKAINAKHAEKMAELKKQQKELREQMDAEIKAVLDAEQKEKFETFQTKREEKRAEMKGKKGIKE